jgi:hypothetical protein
MQANDTHPRDHCRRPAAGAVVPVADPQSAPAEARASLEEALRKRTEGRGVSRCVAARQSRNRECAPPCPGRHRQGCEVRHRPLCSRTAGGQGQPRSCAGHRNSQRRQPALGNRTDPQATGRCFREIGTDRSQPAGRKVRSESTSGDQRRRIAQEPNTVVTVLQKGYLLADRVLRPALVVVAKAKALEIVAIIPSLRLSPDIPVGECSQKRNIERILQWARSSALISARPTPALPSWRTANRR